MSRNLGEDNLSPWIICGDLSREHPPGLGNQIRLCYYMPVEMI